MRSSSTLGRLMQEHQALLQFTRHYLLAHLVGMGQQSGLQPGLQLLHLFLGSSFHIFLGHLSSSVTKGTI